MLPVFRFVGCARHRRPSLMEPRFTHDDLNMPNKARRRLAGVKVKRQLQPNSNLNCRKKKELATAAQYEATTRPTREAWISELKGALHT